MAKLSQEIHSSRCHLSQQREQATIDESYLFPFVTFHLILFQFITGFDVGLVVTAIILQLHQIHVNDVRAD